VNLRRWYPKRLAPLPLRQKPNLLRKQSRPPKRKLPPPRSLHRRKWCVPTDIYAEQYPHAAGVEDLIYWTLYKISSNVFIFLSPLMISVFISLVIFCPSNYLCSSIFYCFLIHRMRCVLLGRYCVLLTMYHYSFALPPPMVFSKDAVFR
jgi:hypothetical protein